MKKSLTYKLVRFLFGRGVPLRAAQDNAGPYKRRRVTATQICHLSPILLIYGFPRALSRKSGKLAGWGL